MTAAREWFSAAELAELNLPGLPSTKPGVLKVVRREGWMGADGKTRKRKGQGGGVEFHVSLLPEAAQARVAAAAAPKAERLDRESAWERLAKLPAGYKAKADERLAVIDQIEDLQRHGLNKSKAIEQVVMTAAREARAAGQEPPLKVATIYTWFARIEGVARADRVAYLAPEWTGRAADTEACSPDAWEFYKGDYLRQSKPPAAGCYKRLLRVAANNGWSVPSLKTLQRRLDREIPPPVQAYFRYGDEALTRHYQHLERDRSGILPMQILNLDGHTWDVFVRWPNGTISRPHALVVQDIASGKVLAIRHDLTLNSRLVKLALCDTFREYGLPDTILMDNGRENAAQEISGGQYRPRWGRTPEQEPDGLLKRLGILALPVTPYRGQAKPIERVFRDFAHDIAKGPDFEGAYTGHNTTAKPENYQSRAIPIERFEDVVRREIAHWNAQSGRRGQGMHGRSHDEVFAEGMARQVRARLTEQQLQLCLLKSKPVSMSKTGAVKIEDHIYWSPELADVRRQKVVVHFDPERMDQPAYIFSVDGRLLAKADRQVPGTFNDLSQAREKMKAERDWKRAQRDAADALRRLSDQDVAAHLQSAPLPEPAAMPAEKTVIAANFGAPRTPEQLGRATAAPDPDFDDAFAAGVNIQWARNG